METGYWFSTDYDEEHPHGRECLHTCYFRDRVFCEKCDFRRRPNLCDGCSNFEMMDTHCFGGGQYD